MIEEKRKENDGEGKKEGWCNKKKKEEEEMEVVWKIRA